MFFWRVSSNCWLYFAVADVAIPITVLIAIIAIPTGLLKKAAFKLAPSPLTAAVKLNVLAVAAPCATVCVSVVCISPSWDNLASICSFSNVSNCKISINWDFSKLLLERTCFNCASVRLTHDDFNIFILCTLCINTNLFHSIKR